MLLNSVITDINYMIKEELGVKGPEKLMTLKGNICQARPPPSSRGTSHKDCFRKCCILQNRLFRHVKATTGVWKLIFTKLINIVPLEQCHHKPMGMYCGGGLLNFSKGCLHTGDDPGEQWSRRDNFQVHSIYLVQCIAFWVHYLHKNVFTTQRYRSSKDALHWWEVWGPSAILRWLSRFTWRAYSQATKVRISE